MTVHVDKAKIIKTVKASQKIEGYSPAQKKTATEAKAIMKKFDVKVSLQK